MKAVMIAATGSGRGKTTFVTGLLDILKNRGVHAFKCGPDYIDPMFHREVLGIPSTNLDLFFSGEEIVNVFMDNALENNIIEAAMGLYDGVGTTSKDSAYDIAKALGCAVVLLVDGHGMGYSIIPLIKGFISMDTEGLIKGIVLNRVSEKYYKKFKTVIEEETGIKLLGYMPFIKGAELKSRHLGLMNPEENEFRMKLSLISDQIKKTVDIDGILNLGQYKEFSHKAYRDKNHGAYGKVGIAKDEAFSFIYEDNIKLLKRLGAKIVYFSPIHDKSIPKDCSHLIFYGGYPENYAKELSENLEMIKSIKTAHDNGVRIIAECGGFMYLLDKMEFNGESFAMAGIISGSSYRTNGLVRFGYVNIEVDGDKEQESGSIKSSHDSNYIELDGYELGPKRIKGHEFHHFETKDIEYSEIMLIRNEASGEKYKGIVYRDNIIAGFPHLYYMSNEEFIKEFLLKR